jgi:hypothetical protein
MLAMMFWIFATPKSLCNNNVTMKCLTAALVVSSLQVTSAFIARPYHINPSPVVALHGKKGSDSDEVVQQQSFAVGSFVEFEEKKRSHVGKIDAVEHKSSGGARYAVIDSEGKVSTGNGVTLQRIL